MFFKSNITAKFFIPIITVFLSLAVVLSFFVNSVIKSSIIERAQDFVADHVISHVSRVLTSDDFYSLNYEEREQNFINLLDEIKTSEVLRIKVWNNEARVIFSDNKDIIGKEFKNDEEYNKAMEGKVAAEIKAPISEENASERGYKQLLEIYIPINLSNSMRPDGVVEVYYKMNKVNKLIADSEFKIFSIVLIGVFILFIFLWYFFKTIIKEPLLELINVSQEIAKGNLRGKMNIKSGDELEKLAVSFSKMVEEIEKKQQELQNTNSKLEQKVKERTGPYENKIKELENKIFDLEKAKNNLEDKLKNYI